jgi:LCP family protein required for cell wall assembly
MTQPNTRGPAAPPTREALRRELRSGFRRALGLTALGTVVPGAGLTRTRSRKIGWVLLILALASLVAGGYYVARHGLTNTALSIVAQPSVLQTVAVVFVVVGIVWCGSIILTAIQSRPTRLDRGRTRALAAFTTLMVFLVAASSFKFAELTTITKDTVKGVFQAAPAKPGQGAKIVTGEDPWAETPRVNVLLLGSDSGVGRTGTRTDSMIVASIDTKTGHTVLISLPRNLERVPLPASSPLRNVYPSGSYGRPTCLHQAANDECMLNAIWTEADTYKQEHPSAYAGEQSAGRSETRQVISEVLGLKLNYTVVVDLHGFEELVDAMGGVTVNVKLGPSGRLPIGGYQSHVDPTKVVNNEGWFKAGVQKLNGHYALWYARARATDSDYYRMQRQRCVIRAVVQQVNPGAMLGKYAELAKIAKDNIYTDVPAQNLPAFVELIERVQKAKMTSVSLTKITDYSSVHPDYAAIHALVKKAIAAPKPAATPSTTPSTPKTSSTRTSRPATPSPTTTPYEQC